MNTHNIPIHRFSYSSVTFSSPIVILKRQGTSADEAQNQGTGFFLYQHWRLMAACVPVDVQVTRQDSSDTLEDSAFLGVVDMGATPLAVPQEEAGVGVDIGFVGLEWMKELGKWRVVVSELKRVLAEYAGHTDLAVGGDGVQVRAYVSYSESCGKI